jgi:hypothetical protein
MIEDGLIGGRSTNEITQCFIPRENQYKFMEEYAGFEIQLKILPTGIKEYKESLFKNQVIEANKSVIKQSESAVITNKSIRDLNTKTDGYYKHQRNVNYAISVFAGLTMLLSVATFLKTCDKPQQNILQVSPDMRLLLDSSLKFHRGIDSSLRKMAKDSIKNVRVLGKKP